MPAVKNTFSIYSLFFYFFTAIFLVACGGGSGGSKSTVAAVTLNALTVNNVSSNLKVNDTFQLTITGSYSDSSTQDLTDEVTWTVANDLVLDVSSAGLVSALSAGTTIVTANYGDLSVQRSLTVKGLASLSISPTSLSLAIDDIQQLTVSGIYTDSSTEVFDDLVDWTSSNSGVASISVSGDVLAVSAGTVTITATSGAVSDSVSVTVLPNLDSLTVSSLIDPLIVGETFQFTVTGNYSDFSTQNLTSVVTWSALDSSILDVTNGLVTALSAGTTTVTASYGSLTVQRSVSVKALDSLSISSASLTLAIDDTQPLTVLGIYTDSSTEAFDDLVNWESSNSGIASVSISGEVLAVSAGTVTITATSGAISETVLVTVLPSLDALSVTDVPSTLKIAETFQLTITGNYSDSSTQDLTDEVTWSVANEAVLEISSSGLVTALSAGSTTVIASYGGLSVDRTISVKALASLSISPTTLTLAINSTQQLSVTGRYTDNSIEVFDDLVSWESSGSGVASVSDGGEVLAVSAGTVSITASVDLISSSLSVTVSEASLQTILVSSQTIQIAAGLNSSFSAIGIYSDGSEQDLSDQVVWSVSDPSKASIDSETGLLTAIQAGTNSVIASKEGKSGSLEITISPATLSSIAITPSVVSLAKGTNATINVTAIFSDNSKQDVSDQVQWSITNNQIVTIENNSVLLLAIEQGVTTVTATLADKTADLSVSVTNADLVSLSLSPINSSIPLGRSQQYSAQGTYTDGTVQDLSSQVTWLSSSENQALISNNESFKGLAESVALGNTTISAVLGDIQQETSLTIENAVLESIEIQPSQQTVANGTDALVAAYGYYSDGSLIDLTSEVLWSTSKASLIDIAYARNGIIHSLDLGSALVSAELNGVSALANISVSAATLQSINISAEQTSLPSGMSQRLVATGTYSDLSSKNISQQVSWHSDDVQVASISNNNAESGLLRALNTGQVNVTASLGLVSDQIELEVTNSILTSLIITSPVSQLNVKSSATMVATANYSDASTQNVSSQVNWLSSDVNIASIGNNVADKGKIKGLSIGNVTITASLNGIVASAIPLEITLNPNLPKALNLSVQPNIILNNNSDSSQVNLALVPSAQGGVIADGTAVALTITEGDDTRVENLETVNGSVSYSLQSTYDGFITLSANAGDFTVSSGVLSSDTLKDALIARGQSNVVYEDNELKAGSVFYMLLRNLSNRVFNIEQIDIGYVVGDSIISFGDSPLTEGQYISDGSLTAGEFTYIGYQLDNDTEASIYIISYLFSDPVSGNRFSLDGIFNFGP